MCHHRYLVERRPSEEYETWEEIEEIPLGGGVRVEPAERERGLALARQLAADYALAHPDRARELVITRYSCNGPLEDERPYPHVAAPGNAAEPEDEPLYRHLTELMLRFRTSADESAEDGLLDALDRRCELLRSDQSRRLAAENLRLRQALTRYADPSAWRARAMAHEPGRMTVELPISADAGASARAALRGEDLPATHQR